MEESTPPPDYLKGFNAGYLMEKELPELAKKLSSVNEKTDHTQGFQDGRRQLVIEKAKEQRKEQTLQPNPTKLKERAKDKDQNLDKE